MVKMKDHNDLLELEISPFKEYLERLLNEQTETIVSRITDQKEETEKQDLKLARAQYESEYKKRCDLELLVDTVNEEKYKIENQYQAVSAECENLKNKIAVASDTIKRLETEAEKNAKYIAKIETDSNLFKNRYADIDNAFDIYLELSNEMKQRLTNIFKAENIYGFMSAIGDWNNVEGLWGFAKRRIIEEESEVEKLVLLVRFLFAAYKQQALVCNYELITPQIGEAYDSDRHSIKGLQTDGHISKVLLDGIFDVNTKRTVLKAIVEVQ